MRGGQVTSAQRGSVVKLSGFVCFFREPLMTREKRLGEKKKTNQSDENLHSHPSPSSKVLLGASRAKIAEVQALSFLQITSPN